MRLVRKTRKAVPGSKSGANGGLGNVLSVGARVKAPNPFPGIITPNGRPPGNPTGRGTSTG